MMPAVICSKPIEPTLSKKSNLLIWATGVSFLLFQFFLQLSSGVVIGTIMHDMHLSALYAGVLSSAFYYVYTLLQIPVGILFDKKNTRVLFTFNAWLCSLGCLLFATGKYFWILVLGRILMGAGSAFAFVGLSHLIRGHFTLKNFAFVIGISETLGLFVAAFGIFGLGRWIHVLSWQKFMMFAWIAGSMIAVLCWYIIPNRTSQKIEISAAYLALKNIFKNKISWVNGVFVGLTFIPVTVFGALWAVPFMQVKLNSDVATASLVAASFFAGTALSCPLFGWLYLQSSRRKPLMLISCILTTALLFIILFAPVYTAGINGILLFLAGISSGAYMYSYTIANELAPPEARSTNTGFVNTLAIISAPIFQPLIGYLLDLSSHGRTANLYNYQQALLCLPIALIIATGLIFTLPEKPPQTGLQ